MPYTKIFETEVGYWNKELSLEGEYPEDIIKRKTPEKMKEIFPKCLFPLIEEYHNKIEIPVVLDVGSGPLSMLSYVEEYNLAKLIAVDPLAEEYKKLLEKYKYEIKYPLIECPGEKLTEKFEENSVDITWIHNALDHSQNPEQVLQEMVRVTKYGGYIVIVTWENEGSHNSFYGLHHHNLSYNEGLCVKSLVDKNTKEMFPTKNLTKHLPLKLISSQISEVNGRKWIEIIYKKQCSVFHTSRNENNKHFFDALVNAWLPVYINPNFHLWGKYALSSNNRGEYVFNLLKKHVDIENKNCLDVGTAYGGFPITALDKGASLALGFELNPEFLKLAKANAKDKGIASEIFFALDITKKKNLKNFEHSFDLITLNDVLEHVVNVEKTLENIIFLLKKEGCVYLEIPNKNYLGFVKADGHYGMFGITLLEKKFAKVYYNCKFPESSYSVEEYYTSAEYTKLFDKFNFKLSILEETFTDFNEANLMLEFENLNETYEEMINNIPEEYKVIVSKGKKKSEVSFKDILRNKITEYLKEFKQDKETLSEEQFKLKYGVPFWKIILKKES
jgi:SAM-dependent methyltransferase